MTTVPRTPHPSSTAPTPTAPPTMRAGSPEDLLAVAPVLLGFWPEESVVMLTFGADHSFHARLPLPPLRAQHPDVLAAAVEKMLEPVRRLHARQVVLLHYSADRAAAASMHEALAEGFAAADVDVLTAIYADGTHWSFLAHGGVDPVPYDISAHPFIVQAIVDGRLTHASRAELERSFDADATSLAPTVAALHEQGLRPADLPSSALPVPALRIEGEWVRATVVGALADDSPPPPSDLARLVWALQAVEVRDAAWSLIERATAAAHVRFWGDVVRRTPQALVAAPAALLGWAAWQAGDGATAWIAVERSLGAVPDYGLAVSLSTVLDRAIPPDAWEHEGFDWAEGLP